MKKSNNVGYLIKEGVRGIFVHGFMSFAAVCVTVACLIIMGSFGLILYNLQATIEKYEQDNQIAAFVDESYPSAEAKSVGSRINMIENVLQSEYVTKEQAMEEFMAKDSQGTYEGLPDDTFRDRFIITLEEVTDMEATVKEVEAIEGIGVGNVRAHYEITNGFITLQSILNLASTAIIAVLLIISLFIISNTVKLALYDRKEEIAIMKMVGATNGFIRWPFVVEGFILGILGAGIAFGVQWLLYDLLQTRIASLDSLQLVTIVPFETVLPFMIVGYAVTGFVVGVFGSLLSIRKFLNV